MDSTGNAVANGSYQIDSINGSGTANFSTDPTTGTITGTNLGVGDGYSVTAEMDGSASAPPLSYALSIFGAHADFSLVNNSSTTVTVIFGINVEYETSLAIQDYSTEWGLVGATAAVYVDSLFEQPPIISQELYQDQCFAYLNLPLIGINEPDIPGLCSETNSNQVLVAYTLPACAISGQCALIHGFSGDFALSGLVEVLPTVPEPNSVILLAIGLGALGARIWKSREKR